MRAEVLGPDDWADWRVLRLEALQDSPVAFCQRYDDALLLPEQAWRTTLEDGVHVLVRDEGRPVGMAEGWVDAQGAGLGAVFVAPSHHGRGLLDLLVDAVAGWARTQGQDRLRLLVHETNAPAAAAYARLGFAATGHREPYPLGPGEEVELACSL